MERVNGCRELGRCSVVCSGFDELIRFESLVVCFDRLSDAWFDVPNGTSYFPFYRPRESTGYGGG